MRARERLPLIASVSFCLAAACDGGGGAGSGDRPDAGAAPDGASGAPACDPAPAGQEAMGVLRIGTSRGWNPPRSSVRGVFVQGTEWFFSGVAPQRQHVTAQEGDCVLYAWEPSFCDPACEAALCDDGECRPYPQYVSAGRIQVAVGGGDPIELGPDAPTYWGQEYNAELASPPEAGDQVSVCAPGSDTAGFSAATRAVAALPADLVPDDNVLELVDGDDLHLSWDNAVADSRVRLTLNADNVGHGLPFRAILECDAPDTGEIVVPRALVEAFPAVERPPENFGCSGTDCPVSEILRYRAIRVRDGGLDLEIRAESTINFRIAH